ncbi:YbaB/EbfC family nucleoid-associated protein [Microbacterium sp. C5A9]|uniref:YbaB/EbfC family nucleoid-associated protein n=1 Tax=Microbacterium sp. C5A9 TaxID=2736663 RepID=UPI001F51F054|nr:YbaB/EbfC family nucleoid-associated protein [Microbacterium sp. C5A9]MCI1017493.1 YbaB/EbfC family nucleoid-associated protein [Microbacterium sp. C5A9]
MDDSTFGIDEGFAAARKQLDDINRQAQQNQARAQALATDVDTLVESVRSPRGEVTVRAKVGGRLAGLEFGPAAEGLALPALAQLTLETIAAAQHRAMAALADRSAELFGAESDIAASIRSDADRGYPSPGLGG